MRFRLALFLVLLTACGGDSPEAEPPTVPQSEFVIVAADSVYWVRTGDEGIRVRGAQMMLNYIGGRFSEIFLTDQDRSFYDAVYVGQSLYKRDLITGDSVLLFSDTLIAALARSYASAHPDERPLAPDEAGHESPRTIATAEVLVIDIHGPWLSYEYRTDIDVIGGQSSHGSRRGVIDLRTGVDVTLDAIFGPSEARRLASAGRARWNDVLDSLTTSFTADGIGGVEELSRFSFDPRSFTLGVEDRNLRVRFAIVQSASVNAGGSYLLDGLDVEAPHWWDEIRDGFPIEEWSEERVWPRVGYSLVSRDASSRSARVSFLIRSDDDQEWRLGSVPSPVLRVMWVDDSTLSPGSRSALTRAFNEAAFSSENLRIAMVN